MAEHSLQETLEIVVLGRRLKVACPKGQEPALQEAAWELDERLKKLRTHSDLCNREQLLTLVALNLSHELRLAEAKSREYADAMDSKIKVLQDTIEQALIHQTKE
ncbi:cell division protein ZapA [Gallaecimonas kandeliae]|uniref:cell division protein ZapA n=1 Tax=Gallaecimonas kandeliae TaxID=3029055 RepID=UPI0026475A18|nr:cell division protein ZapA [Gallaecimonas kandeliae]WKE65118.1 cell division protein ZapA [Gallaecimonas kandeliae]